MARERNDLRSAGGLTQQLQNCGTKAVVWNGYTPYTVRCVGSYKYISQDANTGVFIPGRFRVNDVTIKSGSGSISSGYAEFGCGTSIYRDIVSGPFVALGIPSTLPFGSLDTKLRDYSLQKAFAKTRDVGWELGVFLGEFTETVRLLRAPLASFKKLYENWVYSEGKATMGRLLRGSRDTTNLWLEMRFGLRPLIADIQNIIELIANFEKRNKLGLRRKRARYVSTNKTLEKIPCQITGGNQGLSFVCERTTETSSASISNVYYGLKILDRSLRDMVGMELDDIPSIAWELLRFSFVVDWFLSVGNWIRSLTPNPRVYLVGNCTSQKYTIEQSIVTTSPSCVGGVNRFTPSDFKWTSETLVRTCGTAVPALPAFNPNPLGILRTLDSIALLWQQIGAKLRR